MVNTVTRITRPILLGTDSSIARSGLRRLIFYIALAAIYAGVAYAQVLYGTITGAVTDSTGASIPGAHVVVHNVGTGLDKSVTANGAGEYSASDLPPGTYKVTVTAPGFGQFTQDQATVLANQTLRVNTALAVGAANQSVTVFTAPPALQTEDASNTYNISSEQVAQLPTASSSGRNVQSLFKLVPGATPPYEANSTAANPNRSEPINVNGNSYDNNTQRIDGAVDANPWLPNLVAYLPSPDAIESVNVVTAAFNAEQGSAGGAAVNFTVKSGTNQFHGAVWGYNTNSAFAARGYTVNRTTTPRLPKNILNEDGGRIGGPISRTSSSSLAISTGRPAVQLRTVLSRFRRR